VADKNLNIVETLGSTEMSSPYQGVKKNRIVGIWQLKMREINYGLLGPVVNVSKVLID
jgi:hypothetical protein